MKCILKILLVLFSYYDISFAQAVMWQRFYGNPNGSNSSGRDIQQTFDGGYIIVASSTFPSNILLIKVNYLGEREWQKTINDTSQNIYPSSVIETNDSSFVVTGTRNSVMFIMKIDKLGKFIWRKSYSRPGGISDGFNIQMTSDKGFIVGGYIYFPSIDTSKSYIVKTDSSGNLEWDQIYGDYRFTSGACLLQSSRIYYMTNSSTPNNQTQYTGFCYKINSFGEIIWKRDLGFGKILIPQYQKSCDTILLVGTYETISQNNFYIEKIDTSGKKLFEISYPAMFALRGICNSLNYNIILSGSKLINKKQFDFCAIEFDRNGNYILSKTLNNPIGSDDFNYGVRSTNDNGFIFIGETNYGDSGSFNLNVLAVKTDSVFNTSSIVSIKNLELQSDEFRLFQNYPNPFNNSTIISFILPKSNFASLKIYNIKGEEIYTLLNEFKQIGNYKIIFDGKNISTGIYFYTLRVGNFSETKKFLIIK